MVEKVITSPRNVVDLVYYRRGRDADGAAPETSRLCRHCGAALLDGEREDECSSAFNVSAPGLREPPRKFYAD